MVDIFWNLQGLGGYRILAKMENPKGWGGPIEDSRRGGGMDISCNYTLEV